MPTHVSHPDEAIVLKRRFGQGATNIDKYIELDGYKAVQKAIAEGPEWIINTIKASGLRGRGGAGFPTGMKWSFVPKVSEKPKYVLVNGDESEPGTCKDHLIFLEDPHAVIEGTMIAGLAIGSKLGFIYLRGEYRYLLKIIEKAVADAYAKGFLGKNIFGSGFDFDIITQTGAGAYEVGEESALMESLEGKRGIPRIKPPFPAIVGLYGGDLTVSLPPFPMRAITVHGRACMSYPWAIPCVRPFMKLQAESRAASNSRQSSPEGLPAPS